MNSEMPYLVNFGDTHHFVKRLFTLSQVYCTTTDAQRYMRLHEFPAFVRLGKLALKVKIAFPVAKSVYVD